jgi:uncharacterized membrane protein YgcG
MSWLRRYFKHVLMTPMTVRRHFNAAVLKNIEQAIGAGEQGHSGQVRFVVEAELSTFALWHDVSARDRAKELFAKLGIWNTEHNNGVLLYVLLADRKVEIIADRAIDRAVGRSTWEDIVKQIDTHFTRDEFEAGSLAGITQIHTQLRQHFPHNAEHGVRNNEQSDAPIVL